MGWKPGAVAAESIQSGAHTRRRAPTWYHLVPFGTISYHLVPFRTIWYYLGPAAGGSAHSNHAILGFSWAERAETIRACGNSSKGPPASSAAMLAAASVAVRSAANAVFSTLQQKSRTGIARAGARLGARLQERCGHGFGVLGGVFQAHVSLVAAATHHQSTHIMGRRRRRHRRWRRGGRGRCLRSTRIGGRGLGFRHSTQRPNPGSCTWPRGYESRTFHYAR